MKKTAWAFIVLAAGISPAMAQSDGESAAPVVADQVRAQGHECAEPVSAARDPSEDTDAVWVLTCANAAYKVRLVPDQAAQIEPMN